MTSPPDCIQTDQQWEFVFDDRYSIRFETIGKGVFHTVSSGSLDASHIGPIFERQMEIFPDTGIADGDYHYIADVSQLHGATLKARRLYYDHIRAWYDRHPFKSFIFHGVSRYIRAAINLARHFVEFEVLIVDDLGAALAYAREDRTSPSGTVSEHVSAIQVSECAHAPPEARYVEALLEYLGQISWEMNTSHEPIEVDADHPFGPVFEAINLVKNDFDEIMIERNRALDELQDRSAFIEAVTDSLPVGLLVSRMEDRRLIYANSRFMEICGWDRESLRTLDRFVEMALQQTDINKLLKDLQAIASDHSRPRLDWLDLPLTTALQAQKYVSLVTVPLMNQQILITTMMDVSDRVQVQTEKKKLQMDLLQAQKMEAIGTLAGGIAHDFNNVLAAIMGFVELALFDIPENMAVRDNLDQVLKASHRARELVKQILAFSRKDVGLKKDLQLQPLVEESLSLIRASLPASIVIKSNLSSPGGIVNMDATQIQQVLLNLCTNAAHAMETLGGVLEIQLSEQTIDDTLAESILDLEIGAYLRLTVGDTGHGMTDEVRQRIFDPFFTTKEQGKGTGMGLSVVHGIVRAHGGAIQVESGQGEGSRFHIYLPHRRQPQQLSAPEDGTVPGGSEHILFVDDELMLIDMGRQMLERLGYRVTTRTSSVEALEAFRARPDAFDMVISDMTMPNMTGDRLARNILAIREDMPIVLCSGFSSMMNPQRAVKIGIRAYLAKPLSLRELAQTVREAFDKNSAAGQNIPSENSHR